MSSMRELGDNVKAL